MRSKGKPAWRTRAACWARFPFESVATVNLRPSRVRPGTASGQGGRRSHPRASPSPARASNDPRRHTDADGDVLTPDGVLAALDIGRRLEGSYDTMISSGAQRATQTLACFLAGMGRTVSGGVIVNSGFRSGVEERWFAAAREA